LFEIILVLDHVGTLGLLLVHIVSMKLVAHHLAWLALAMQEGVLGIWSLILN